MERKSTKKSRVTYAVADLPGAVGPVRRKINGEQRSPVTIAVADTPEEYYKPVKTTILGSCAPRIPPND